MYLFWRFVHQGRTVVYDCTEIGVVFYVTATSFRIFKSPASIVDIPDLIRSKTIYIYDANAREHREPVVCSAFLIETAARNINNYAQNRRRGVDMYCIPSYDEDELLRICDLFDTTAEEVRRRCRKIGPSIGYVLASKVFLTTLAGISATIDELKCKNIHKYLEETTRYYSVTGPSACLLKSLVHEEDFEDDPTQAYEDRHVDWQIASYDIATELIRQSTSDAQAFVKRYIMTTEGVSKLRGITGNYLQTVVDTFIAQGGFTYRRLLDSGAMSDSAVMPMNLSPLKIEKPSTITTVAEALELCTERDSLFVLCGKFSGFDFVTRDFCCLYQVALAPRHTMHLETILTVCDYVKKKYPNEKVKYFFLVPAYEYDQFITPQSFYVKKAQEAERSADVKTEVAHPKAKAISIMSLQNLSQDVQERLSNFEQYVIRYE